MRVPLAGGILAAAVEVGVFVRKKYRKILRGKKMVLEG